MTTNKNRLRSMLGELRGSAMGVQRQATLADMIEAALDRPDEDPDAPITDKPKSLKEIVDNYTKPKTTLKDIIDRFTKYAPAYGAGIKDTRTVLLLDALKNIDERLHLLEKRSEGRRYDHHFKPGAYGVCQRCGEEKHEGPG